MLVLTRREKESLVIDDRIKLIVKKISPTRVRLAIEAPPGTHVLRQEVCDLSPKPRENHQSIEEIQIQNDIP